MGVQDSGGGFGIGASVALLGATGSVAGNASMNLAGSLYRGGSVLKSGAGNLAKKGLDKLSGTKAGGKAKEAFNASETAKNTAGDAMKGAKAGATVGGGLGAVTGPIGTGIGKVAGATAGAAAGATYSAGRAMVRQGIKATGRFYDSMKKVLKKV